MYWIETPVCWEIWRIMNKSLLTNIEVDSSCVWVDLVDVMVAMVDQVLLQVSKPESGVIPHICHFFTRTHFES